MSSAYSTSAHIGEGHRRQVGGGSPALVSTMPGNWIFLPGQSSLGHEGVLEPRSQQELTFSSPCLPPRSALSLRCIADLQDPLSLHLPSANGPQFCVVPTWRWWERKGILWKTGSLGMVLLLPSKTPRFGRAVKERYGAKPPDSNLSLPFSSWSPQTRYLPL